MPLSVRTPLAHSASLALENWTGRNNNEEAEKKGKEAERVKLACGATTMPPVSVAVAAVVRAQVPDDGPAQTLQQQKINATY